MIFLLVRALEGFPPRIDGEHGLRAGFESGGEKGGAEA